MTRIFNQNPPGESQPNSPSFQSRRHSSCIDDNMDSEADETVSRFFTLYRHSL